MRSGCLNVVFVLIAASVATVLTVVGAALFLSFAALTLETSEGIETVLKMVVALVAGYFFIRVGWSVWQDLRGRGRKVGSGEGRQEEERGPAGDGER
jgi:hypothetical protein